MITNTGLSQFETLRLAHPAEPASALVRRMCDALLADVEEAGIPPVQVRRIASARGIADIRVIELDESSGILWEEGGRLVAAVHALDRPARRRFSALHEVGHTLLPGYATLPQRRCESTKSTFVERMADLAASELLFPRDAFALDLAVRPFGLRAIEDIAHLYGASLEATARRALDLAVEPRMLLIYGEDSPLRGGKAPALRLRFARRSGNWPRLPAAVVELHGTLGRAWRNQPVDEEVTPRDLPSLVANRARLSARRYGSRLFVLLGR